MAQKTIEQLEAEMNAQRVQRNQALVTKLDKAQQKQPRKKRHLGLKLMVLLVVVLAALLALAWMILQRTHIFIGLGAVAIPGITS